MEPTVSLADHRQSLPEAPSLYRQRRLRQSLWTQDPEPHRLLGPSLPLTLLVLRHHVPRGCPATESDTHEECLRTQPATLRRPERGHRRVSRAWDLRVPLFHVEPAPRKHRPSIGVWCSSQAVTSNRNQVSRTCLVTTTHPLFHGRPPRLRAMHPSALLTPEP